MRELEAKRNATPPTVFARVHADYSNRLNAVAEQLREHAKSMQQHAGNLMAKLREVEATTKKLEDDLAESQIRRQVGELSSSEFDTYSKKAQREIARLEDDQERIADDLNRIRHMLGGREPSADEEDERPRTSQDFDELEFLQSVVGTATPSGTPMPKMTPTGNSTPHRQTIARPMTPASHTPAHEAQPPAPAQPPAAAAQPVPPPMVVTDSTPPAAPPSAASEFKPKQPTPPEGPLAIRSPGALEQPKTLRCAECGQMNYPSEWYCERCGGELAAI